MSSSHQPAPPFVAVAPVCALCVLALAVLAWWWRRSLAGPVGTAGRGVLVTGCDSGFGHRLALRLDARGFTVFAGCLLPQGPGARRLAQQGSAQLRVLRLDVTSDNDVQEALAFVQKHLPEKGLWALVNNAGVVTWGETEWSSVQLYRRLLDVNLLGSIRTTLAFLPLLRASRGRVVFVSSVLAFFTCLNMGAYSVSKRGLEAFADCLRVEMQSFGVKVSIIQPGNYGGATGILDSLVGDAWDSLSARQQRVFSRDYVLLASHHFLSVSRAGRAEAGPVVDAMLHAVASGRPRRRYLLVSAAERLFFSLYPLLPAALADALFSLSPLYSRRSRELYRQP